MEGSKAVTWAAAGWAAVLLSLPAAAQAGSEKKTAAAPVAVSGEMRGRWEGPTGLNYREGTDDSYLLTRARLLIKMRVTRWLTGAAEFQDAHAFGYAKPVPGSVTNRADLRQAWLQVGSAGESPLALRAGRMPLKFGAGRLVWDPDWSNTGTVFDGLLATAAAGRAKVELVAAEPVTPLDRRWDQRNRGAALYGAYSTVRAGRGHVVEPYALFRRIQTAAQPVPQTHAAYGARLAGSAATPVRYEVELTGQGGTLGGAPLRAFGAVASATVTLVSSPLAPVMTLTYTHATGDRNATDGVRRTFQVFYPTTHLRTGATDRIGWSNLRDFLAEGKWKLPRKSALTAGMHLPRLDTIADAVYSRSGSIICSNPRASSPRLGTELFLLWEVEISKRWLAGVGIAHLFAGPYLRDSGRGSVTQPYFFLTHRF